MPATRVLVLICFALAPLSACEQASGGPSEEQTRAARYAKAPSSFLDDKGQTITLEARAGYGYTLRGPSGVKAGKVKVESDRVKVKDASDALLAKVKSKSDGFKLSDGNDAVLLKGKRKGDQLRLKDATGADVARLPWGDASALAGVGGITAHQRMALLVYLADVEGR